MKFFSLDEFKCPCCDIEKMENDVLAKIDGIRQKMGMPLHINSGYRCSRHNREVGGKTDSRHLFGKAIDVSHANMTAQQRSEFLALVMKDFNGIGIAKTYFHMDLRDEGEVWVYPV